MAQDTKRILVVDDSLVDRMVLKSILEAEPSFEVVVAESGNKAFEYISTKGQELDAMLLDLSMPHIDGFDVLSFMKEKRMDEIPVFVVTSESTESNVLKAYQYNISDFIKKPYDSGDVLGRLRSRMGLIPEYDLTKEELQETMEYIDKLETFYKTYLATIEKSDMPCVRRSELMKIMLDYYHKTEAGKGLNADSITLISKAAYFCDIGEMLIPESRQDMKERHTMLGADLIRLNSSKACRYFVEVCASMCLHHHERYDGMGYPYRIRGKSNSVYNQMCRALDEIEESRAAYSNDKAKPVKFIVGHLVSDGMGVAGKEVRELLQECEQVICTAYM